MFKIAKLEKANNETVNIKLVTLEKNKFENGKKVSETFRTLSFDISSDDYSLYFGLNCKLEKLLEIPMNKKIDFNNYISGGTYLEVHDIADFDIKTDIKITRYLKNKFIIFLTFFTDYAFEDENDYGGMIEITFNLDDYLENKINESSKSEKL